MKDVTIPVIYKIQLRKLSKRKKNLIIFFNELLLLLCYSRNRNITYEKEDSIECE